MGKNGVKSTAFPNSISNTLKKRRTQFKKPPNSVRTILHMLNCLKHINTTINMALYTEKDLKFTWGSRWHSTVACGLLWSAGRKVTWRANLSQQMWTGVACNTGNQHSWYMFEVCRIYKNKLKFNSSEGVPRFLKHMSKNVLLWYYVFSKGNKT